MCSALGAICVSCTIVQCVESSNCISKCNTALVRRSQVAYLAYTHDYPKRLYNRHEARTGSTTDGRSSGDRQGRSGTRAHSST
ncbi:hypothetical protein QBC35DRAFT_482901 [Podospora australis]|uniref:Secreted protein n=1 Tax=Podospora australis TaxID=1536484 RepID=A0AAN6X271_9PEZI|nr:hypothetical protein QBC35DRAFT_482901 [Podospora australis]